MNEVRCWPARTYTHDKSAVEFYEPNEMVNEQEQYEQYVFPDPPMNMHPPPPPLSPNDDVVSQEPEVDVSEENIQLLMVWMMIVIDL